MAPALLLETSPPPAFAALAAPLRVQEQFARYERLSGGCTLGRKGKRWDIVALA